MLTQKSKKINNIMIELHPYEVWLIKRWRERYRYGSFTVVIHNGLPQRITDINTYEDPRDEVKL